MNKLLLASASPRRRELFSYLGFPFDCLSPDILEQKHSDESPSDYVQRLAKEKALAGLSLSSEHTLSIGSDTIIVCDEHIFEKPTVYEDALRMLSTLSGRFHEVFTAICVTDGKQIEQELVISKVWFRSLTENDIEQYWHSGEPKDKAGAYAIQGYGGRFVQRIEGSYHAIVGLPLVETEALINRFRG